MASVACLAAVPLFRADFHDIAGAAGLNAVNVYGGIDRKDFILETTGNGVAIFDYDKDSQNDISLPAERDWREITNRLARNSITTMGTDTSPTSPRRLGSASPAGSKGFAWEITTTTDIRTCW